MVGSWHTKLIDDVQFGYYWISDIIIYILGAYFVLCAILRLIENISFISRLKLINITLLADPRATFIGYWTNTVFWDRVLWSEFDHRACEVINLTKEWGPKTLYEFNNRIIICLYKIINFIKYHQIYVGLFIIIKYFEHQFIPKHRIRIDIAFICMLA